MVDAVTLERSSIGYRECCHTVEALISTYDACSCHHHYCSQSRCCSLCDGWKVWYGLRATILLVAREWSRSPRRRRRFRKRVTTYSGCVSKYQSSCSAIMDSMNTSIGVDGKARDIPVSQHNDRSKPIAILSNYTRLSSFPVNMKELETASL